MTAHILIIVFLIIFLVIFNKNRFVSLCAFVYMWMLWGWNAWNGDYEAYEYIYNLTQTKPSVNLQVEVGYFYLNKFFSKIVGLTFSEFLIFYSFLVLAIIYYWSSKLCNRIGYFTLIYFIIFILEYVYMRNALSHALILSILFTWIFRKDIGLKKFVFLILLSSLIHSSALIFLIFAIAVKRDSIFKIRKVIQLAVLFFFSGIFFFNYLINYLGDFFINKIEAYSGFAGISNSFLGLILLVFVSVYYFKNCIDQNSLNEQKKVMLVKFININLLTLFMLTIFFFIPYASRIFRLLLMINIIGMLHFYTYVYNYEIKKFISKSVYIFFLIFTLLLFHGATHKWVTYPLFNVNKIFGSSYYETIN